RAALRSPPERVRTELREAVPEAGAMPRRRMVPPHREAVHPLARRGSERPAAGHQPPSSLRKCLVLATVAPGCETGPLVTAIPARDQHNILPGVACSCRTGTGRTLPHPGAGGCGPDPGPGQARVEPGSSPGRPRVEPGSSPSLAGPRFPRPELVAGLT